MKTKTLSLFILFLSAAGNVSAQVSPFNTEVSMGVGPDLKSMTYEERIAATSGSLSPELAERFREELEAHNHIAVLPLSKVIKKTDEVESIPEPVFELVNENLEDNKPIFQNLD